MTSEAVRIDWREVAHDLSHNVDSCIVSHLPLAQPLVDL